MRFIFILLVLFIFDALAQENQIYGLIDNGGEKYLISDSGLISTDNDVYLEYYKSIYGDSTITNPNLVLNNKSFKIIPVINMRDWSNLNFEIAPQIYFYDFLEYDSLGSIIVNPNISQYLQNYNSFEVKRQK